MNPPVTVVTRDREREPYIDEPISPELVLVDPELARWARPALSGPGFPARPVPASTTSLRTRLSLTPAAPVAAPPSPPAALELPEPARPRVEPRRRPVRRALAVLALYVVLPILLVSAIAYAAEFVSDPEPALFSSPPATTASAEAPAPPKAVTPSSPTAQPAVFVWLPVKDAAAYRLELFRERKRVFAAVTKQPRLELPPSWLYESVRYRLERGTYRWVVRPLRNRGSGFIPGDPVVDSVWVVRAPAG